MKNSLPIRWYLADFPDAVHIWLKIPLAFKCTFDSHPKTQVGISKNKVWYSWHHVPRTNKTCIPRTAPLILKTSFPWIMVFISHVQLAARHRTTGGGSSNDWSEVKWYCWWFRNPAITSWYGKHLNIPVPLFIGFYHTFQVVVWDFFHQQYHQILHFEKGFLEWITSLFLRLKKHSKKKEWIWGKYSKSCQLNFTTNHVCVGSIIALSSAKLS